MKTGHFISAARILPVTALIVCFALVAIAGCASQNTGVSASQQSGQATVSASPATGTQAAPPAAATTAVPACRAGLTDCNGGCRDIAVDIGNCGACGKVCPSNSTCKEGRCYCKDRFSATLDGTCIAIPATETTTPAGCSAYPGTTRCGTLCVYLDSDPGYCGSCNIQCRTGQKCTNGQCISPTTATTCSTGEKECGGTCVDVLTDPDNCGSCGWRCSDMAAGALCRLGSCTCPQGMTGCELTHQCVNLQNDNNNCGTCGNACKDGATCSAAMCSCPVPEGRDYQYAIMAYCDGKCIDINGDDDKNCGGCGITCGSGHCMYGTCV